ncbi:MAG: hypothetical protein JWP76_2249 [Dactylosporangium sp.]|jgi:hypothetical protein|nr:hypothetical protein [Dactylosporangium sp.]
MLLADDYFLLAHDDRSGKAIISPKSLELGLAGAMIAELVLEQRLLVEGSLLRVLRTDPPADALAHTILATMIAEPQHQEVRTWLAYLGQTAVDSVGQRMARVGIAQQIQARRLLKTVTRYVATDINLPAGRVVRLRRLLMGAAPMYAADSTLAGLAAVTGLTGHVLWDGHSAGLKRLQHAIAGMPPPLRHLVAQVEAAVGDAVLSQRN